MKKLISIVVILMVAVAFLVVGNTKAEAMNNESAAVLTAGMVLLGIPVMHAIAMEAAHHDRAYGHAYAPPRYIERTKIVYVDPRHKRMQRHRMKEQWGTRHGWDRHQYGPGHKDSRRDSRPDQKNGRRK